ncbi:MAG: glycosyltransferase family 4 protein [Acidimicrobiales bacterium]
MTIDLRPAQLVAYRERGVARYALELTRAMVRRHADLVGAVLVDPRLPPVGRVEELVALGGARPFGDWVEAARRPADLPGGRILHLTSPFDLEIPLGQLWPRASTAAGSKLVVTVYDLIPDVFVEDYLADPGLRRRWRARRELVRSADRVLAISEATRRDVVERLGVDPGRVTNVGAGCSEGFRPPGPGDDPAAAARNLVPGLRRRFAVYNGGVDARKNLDRLLSAWALLAPPLREQVQLVVVCRMDPLQRNHYRVTAGRLGIAGDLLLAGAVPDEALMRLYQATDLMVFPSLYEGYGLPVVEARACGAPVLVADSPGVSELVGPERRFDPRDVEAMAAAISTALCAPRAAAGPGSLPPSWDAVADRAAEVYAGLLGHPSPPPIAGSRLALFAGSDDRGLLELLSAAGEVDVYGLDSRAVTVARAAGAACGGYTAAFVRLRGAERVELLDEVRRLGCVVVAVADSHTGVAAADRCDQVWATTETELARLRCGVLPEHLDRLSVVPRAAPAPPASPSQ